MCTPHLGASTTEAQEGVSTEVAEAVIDALQGKLSSTAVNAPLVSAEVLKELAPFVALAEGLGKVGYVPSTLHCGKANCCVNKCVLTAHCTADICMRAVKKTAWTC